MYHIGPHEIDIIICMNEHEPIKRFKKIGLFCPGPKNLSDIWYFGEYFVLCF